MTSANGLVPSFAPTGDWHAGARDRRRTERVWSRRRRTVTNFGAAIEVISDRIREARADGRPIAFVRHHNPEPDTDAFIAGSWGAEFAPGIEPSPDRADEVEFVKEVVGAFSTTRLEFWLRERGAESVLLVGFYAHQCLSTSAREAYVLSFEVAVDPDGTGSRAIEHELLGRQTGDEVRRTALLHLSGMGVAITPRVAGGFRADSLERRPVAADY